MTDSGSPPRAPPGPSREDKEKATIGEPTTVTTDDNQLDRSYTGTEPTINPSEGQETNVVQVLFNPAPRPSNMPTEAMCFTMTLSLIEVAEPHMKLRLSRDDAYLLTDSDDLLKDPPILFSRELLVLDEFNKLYNMIISNHGSGSLSRYHVNTEWREFALSNKLKVNDNLMFYRFLDDASGHWYYRLDVFKIPPPPPSLQKEETSEPDSDHSDDPGDDANCYLSRTLSASEVDGGPLDTILLLDGTAAYDLTGLVAFLADDVMVSSKTLHVCDERHMRYDLQLSPFTPNKAFVGYSISGQWAELVADNKLEVGDQVLFMYTMEENENASDGYNYEIKFIRKKSKVSKIKVKFSKRTSEEERCPDRIMRPGPGSRCISNQRSCFSKSLSAHEVVHDGGKPRLFLDAQGAGRFFECPGIEKKYGLGELRENLVVFDAGNRQYDMLFSNISPYGEVIFVVDAGWQRFVKIHTLKAGDGIYFYRIMDTNVHHKPYYVVRYIRNNFPSWRVANGAGTSGNANAGVGPSGSRAGPSGSTGAGPSGSTGAGPSGSAGAGPSYTGH